MERGSAPSLAKPRSSAGGRAPGSPIIARSCRALMQFDSFTFITFFALVLGVYNALRGWAARKWLLLSASYAFYAAWNPAFVPLLAGSTTLDWWIAQRIHAAATPRARKRWITLTVAVNLGVLALFK